MTPGERYYLLLLLGTFGAFAATLAFCAWEQMRPSGARVADEGPQAVPTA